MKFLETAHLFSDKNYLYCYYPKGYLKAYNLHSNKCYLKKIESIPDCTATKKIRFTLYDLIIQSLYFSSFFIVIKLLLLFYHLIKTDFTVTIPLILVNFIVLLLNIYLHELSHYLAMLFSGIHNKGFFLKYHNFLLKFGVDTRPATILPNFRRFTIYAAGISANCICFIFFTHFIGVQYLPLSLVIFLYNYIPLAGESNDTLMILKLFRKENTL